MKNFITLIPRIFYLAYKIFTTLFDPKVSIKIKLFFLLSIIYIISPYDLIRDIIPILGQVDDILVFIIAILVYKFQDFKRNLNKNPKETIIEGEFRNIDSDTEWSKYFMGYFTGKRIRNIYIDLMDSLQKKIRMQFNGI